METALADTGRTDKLRLGQPVFFEPLHRQLRGALSHKAGRIGTKTGLRIGCAVGNILHVKRPFGKKKDPIPPFFIMFDSV